MWNYFPTTSGNAISNSPVHESHRHAEAHRAPLFVFCLFIFNPVKPYLVVFFFMKRHFSQQVMRNTHDRLCVDILLAILF